MVHLEVLQFDPKFLACKMVLNNCSSYILKIHFRRKFLNAALNRFGVVLVVYMCLYIKVMHVHFECRRFIHLHKYILVICFKRAYIHLLCVHVEWVSVCGWKTYDMWQLVGRCHRGGRKQRGELLLPWRPHRVAHGRVAWSRNQLRERELNNRTRERRKNIIFFIHIYRAKQRAEASDGVAIPRSWHLHKANIQPTQKQGEIRNLFRNKCNRSSFRGCYARFHTRSNFSFFTLSLSPFLFASCS